MPDKQKDARCRWHPTDKENAVSLSVRAKGSENSVFLMEYGEPELMRSFAAYDYSIEH
jgi:hypothetical protein